jgi:4-hydroxy-2-oxoheptanedioate aldolase
MLARIASTATQRGIIPGIHTGSPAYAQKMRDIGFRFITVMTDVSLLAGVARQTLAQARQSSGESR